MNLQKVKKENKNNERSLKLLWHKEQTLCFFVKSNIGRVGAIVNLRYTRQFCAIPLSELLDLVQPVASMLAGSRGPGKTPTQHSSIDEC